MTGLSKKQIRRLFILILLGLFAQIYFVLKYQQEPFPAIMMPRFSYQEIKDSIISFSQVQIQLKFKDSSSIIISKHDLFSDIHLPQRNKILRRVFLPDSTSRHKVALKAWLTNSMKKISRREDLDYVDFNWENVFWKFGNHNHPIQTKDLGKKRIYL